MYSIKELRPEVPDLWNQCRHGCPDRGWELWSGVSIHKEVQAEGIAGLRKYLDPVLRPAIGSLMSLLGSFSRASSIGKFLAGWTSDVRTEALIALGRLANERISEV